MTNQLHVAFQGEPGAYSELAALEYFGNQIKTKPCLTFDDVFDAVCDGNSSHGLLPVENSLAGSIHRNYDLMLRHELHIVGEYHFPRQSLLNGASGRTCGRDQTRTLTPTGFSAM